MNKDILFVDDEAEILNSIKRQFRKSDFNILTAQSGMEGLEILSRQTIPLVVSDERMPDMNGVEFLQEVKKKYPETIRIILSGYADGNAIIDAINKGEVFRFITKPWNSDELLQILDQAFVQYEVMKRNRVYMDKIIEENRRLKQSFPGRDFVLEFTSEILEDLPVPVLVVGKDDRIVLFNRKMSNFCPVQDGSELNLVFSKEIEDLILRGFNNPGGQKGMTCHIPDKTVKLLVRSLRNHDEYKGLVIIEEIL